MQAISNDKRELIIAAKARGEKIATIALWIGVSVKSVTSICRLYKQSNTITPKPFTGRRTILTDSHLMQIKKTVEMQPDITLEEMIETLELPIKKSRLSQVLISMGFSFKKRLSIQKSKNVKMFKTNELNGELTKLN